MEKHEKLTWSVRVCGDIHDLGFRVNLLVGCRE